MKILIVGTGVIGSVYSWQLSKIGHDIIHFVRKGTKNDIDTRGIPIRCRDMRNGKDTWHSVIYHPTTIEDFPSCSDVDLIIISVKSNQLKPILSLFRNNIHNANILLFQNNWYSLDELEQYLPPSKYFFGFPHVMGGGKDEKGIYCTIFGNKLAQTMLGEKDGKTTERVLNLSNEFKKAGLNPKISKDINAWILTHYAEATGLLAGVMYAGSGIKFVSDSHFIKESILAIREGFNICKYKGINVRKVHPQRLYYLPLFLLVPFFKKMYSSDGAQLMIKGHISHSPDEMKSMFYDVYATGQQYDLDMPTLSTLKKYVDEFSI